MDGHRAHPPDLRLPTGPTPYTVVARYLKRQGGHERLLATTPAAVGAVTVSSPAPVLTVTSFEDGLVTRNSTVTAAGTVTGSGTLSLTIQGENVPIASDGSFSHVVAIPDGSSTITFVASDTEGRSTQRVFTVTRDSVSPVVQILEPADGSAINQARPLIRVSLADASPSSGLDLSTFRGNVDGNPVTFTVGPSEATFTPSEPLADSVHTVTASIRDRAGNTSQIATSTFATDTVKPIIQIVAVADGSATRETQPTFRVSYSDATGGLRLSSFEATLNGSAVSFTVGSEEATLTPTTPLANGTFTLVVRISDSVQNTAEATSTFAIDDRPPAVSLSPAQDAILTTSSTTLTASYVDATPSSGLDLPASFRATVDHQDRSTSFEIGPDRATLAVPLSEGSHEWSAQVADKAGGVGSASVTFLVDTQSPVLSVVSPAQSATLVTTTPHFELAFSDPSPGSGLLLSSLKVVIDQVDRTADFTTTADRATFDVPATAGLSPGEHLVQTEIFDRAGHKATAQASFVLSPPLVGPSGILVGQILTGDICNNQPLIGATVRLIYSGGVALSDAAGRFTIPAPAGLVWVEVAKDGFLSVQRSVQVAEGQTGALPPVYLAAQDSKVTHIVASQGGIVTDSTGDATLDLPPAALPQDADVVMTIIQDRKGSKGPPLKNFIPGVAVRLLPDHIRLNAPATLRVRNRLQMPVHPIFSFDWNDQTQIWERTVGARITPDGQFFESTIDHFSGAAPG